jgi:CheY-like chemotaxis protein
MRLENDMPLKVLLVEDNVSDVVLMEEAIGVAGLRLDLNVVGDGIEAMDYLYRRDGFTRALRPDMMVLDLNMPRKNGREVMQELSESQELRMLPVAILTTSASESHLPEEYPSLRCRFFTKSCDFKDLVQTVRDINDFGRSCEMLKAQ